MSGVKLPKSAELGYSLLEVLREAPNGLTTKQIDEAVAIRIGLTSEQSEVIHSGSRTEFAYRLAWERTRAKKRGQIEQAPGRLWRLVNVQKL